MLFNSYAYLFAFLPVALAGYFLLGSWREGRYANAWLLLASLFFYGYWNILYLPLLCGSIAVNYLISGALIRSLKEKLALRSRGLFLLGMAFNLGLLCYYKYTDFLLENLNLALGTHFELLHLLLPLGISFFSITQMVFLIGVYFYGDGKKNRSFVNYALFVSFFPHLMAGPILYHKSMMKQFADPALRHPQAENIARGLFLLVIGLFKKVIIADSFIEPVGAGFSHPEALTVLDGWAVAAGYAIQIYFDFSGYTDMAVGAARMLNIEIPINFRTPFRSMNLIDFWRRWHISLTNTITSYIYTPMVLHFRQMTLAKSIFATVVTMVVIGIWHGSGWTYVLFGFLQGLGLGVNQVWKQKNLPCPGWLARILTLGFIVTALVLFRAESVTEALGVYRAMLGLGGGGLVLPWEVSASHLSLFLDRSPFTYIPDWGMHLGIVLTLALLCFCPDSNELARRFRPGVKWAAALALLFVFSVLHFTRVTAFLYFQF